MHANHVKKSKCSPATSPPASGPERTTTGDTLCAIRKPDHPGAHGVPGAGDLALRSNRRPKADQEKMGIALNRLAQEDPSFRVHTDEESRSDHHFGRMGELHLEIIVDRMKREFNVEANVGAPAGRLPRTIRKSVEQEGKFVAVRRSRSVRSRLLKIEPQRPARATSSSTPSRRRRAARVHPAVDKGIQETLPTACWPASRLSTSGHPVRRFVPRCRTPTKMAFKMAGPWRSGSDARRALLLEPMMAVESKPGGYMGNVIGDLNRSSWHRSGMDDSPWRHQGDQGRSPAGRDVRLLHQMRSLTQGRATYSMEFKHSYNEAPKNVARPSSTRNNCQFNPGSQNG